MDAHGCGDKMLSSAKSISCDIMLSSDTMVGGGQAQTHSILLAVKRASF